MTRKNKFILFVALIISITSSAWCEPAVTPSSTTKPAAETTKDVASMLDISDLTLEMAESRFKLRPDEQTVTSYIVALEKFLENNCFKDLIKKLSYDGHPSDPQCFDRMDTLLKLYPSSPVGICIRDGIEADSCVQAYAAQATVEYDGSQDSNSSFLISPALKTGPSAEEIENFRKLTDSIEAIAEKFDQPGPEEEKQKLRTEALSIYEKQMAIICKASATWLVPKPKPEPSEEETRIEAARKKLLDIPAGLRGDYQLKMRKEYEESYAHATTDKERNEIKKILEVIDNPQPSLAVSDQFTRTRYILPGCAKTIQVARQFDTKMPQPTCYEKGWYTPQCVRAIKAYQKSKKVGPAKTPGKSSSVISTF